MQTVLCVVAMLCAGVGWAEVLTDGWTADGVPVTVPHDWNAVDGAGGEDVPPPPGAELWRHDSTTYPGYARKVVTYRRALPDKADGTRYFFRSEGASIKATVRVNGREAGRHVGAFTAFTSELTPFMKATGNVLEVVVDNRIDRNVPPVCADYNMDGGLYRPCHLLVTGPEGLPSEPDVAHPKYEIRADGFYVDGVKTIMRGVCYHQDTAERGWAMTPEDEERDIRMIKAMGANAIRTSHYPRGPHFFELCDRYGLYVWTEIPLVDAVTPGEAFRSNTLTCAREMVEQLKRHPSVAMWGLFNELYLKKMPDGTAEPLVKEVNDLIKTLDPTRPTVAAVAKPERLALNAIPDAAALNDYPGWYGGVSEDIVKDVDAYLRMNGRTSCAVSEFGAGGSIKHHENPLVTEPDPGGRWHPEERETDQHIRQYRVLRKEPRVWGFYMWQMFDSASDSRAEGDANGINDKGLATRDRQPKDAYFFYKANWNPEPMLHLCSTRMASTDKDVWDVVAFSNGGDVTLTVNGKTVGTKTPDEVKTVVWKGVALASGMNEIVVTSGPRTVRHFLKSGNGHSCPFVTSENGHSCPFKKGTHPPLNAQECAFSECLSLSDFPSFSSPRALTSGPRDHFFANYFGINAWSPDKRYVLALETDLKDKMPDGAPCTLGLVDTADGNPSSSSTSPRPGRFIPVTTTRCWNFQEAAMAHWLPAEPDTFVFNDLRDGKFCAVVLNWKTKKERVYPFPVSAVSEDGTWAISINYARLYLARPDYGYAGDGQDARANVTFPEDDGLWRVDLKTGAAKLILPTASLKGLVPKVAEGGLSYLCHTVISKDGHHIYFLSRSVDCSMAGVKKFKGVNWQTTAFTCRADGTEVRRCFPDGWGSSHFNWKPNLSERDARTMVVTCNWLNKVYAHVEFTVGDEDHPRQLGGQAMDFDGHCIYSPDGRFVTGDGYWDKDFKRHWKIVRLSDNAVRDIGSFYVPEAYRDIYCRCDLHPRWRPDGRQLGFNSVHEGSRQIYVMDVEK